ncbi:MFS general substrate transporter [Mollisia scopiformis]|uniref:MFS general substrate transporter n=1 Tax=Mollisia scopiformis TaxID=149040 RepID=A0A132B8E8_MOLSC|nr:MFS general substrate transporter [Mollisia scopiformis]KUJ08154.1 MFS general substrate transporter [Mollisia scopiformis]
MDHPDPELEAGRTPTVRIDNEKEREHEEKIQPNDHKPENADLLPRPRTLSATSEERKYIVDWEENDRDNPLNWPALKKWKNLWIVSSITLITPLASSMFAPGVPQLMEEFHSTNVELASFVVSVYILGFAIGPIKVYQCCNILFLACTIVCGESPNLGMLLAFRFWAGCAGVAPLTIGAGSVGDLMRAEERGGAMAIFSLGTLIGPIIGPIAGGYISQSIGWRWVFRILSCASPVVTVVTFFLDETYATTLLEAKAKKLRETHNDPAYKSKYASGLPKKVVWKRAIVRPLKMLFLSPIVSLLSLHLSLVYGLLYVLFTTFTAVFEGIYGFSTGSAGLTFLGLGVGTILGVVIIGGTADRIYMYYEKRNNGVGKPEFRLPAMVVTSLFCPIGLFWYGWSAQAHAYFLVPIIGTVFMAFGMMSVMLPVQNYLVDAYTRYAASAIAAATILRSILGALLPLAGQPMYDKLGIGWGNSLLGFLALAMTPIPWVFWKYGERIRTRNPIDLD